MDFKSFMAEAETRKKEQNGFSDFMDEARGRQETAAKQPEAAGSSTASALPGMSARLDSARPLSRFLQDAKAKAGGALSGPMWDSHSTQPTGSTAAARVADPLTEMAREEAHRATSGVNAVGKRTAAPGTLGGGGREYGNVKNDSAPRMRTGYISAFTPTSDMYLNPYTAEAARTMQEQADAAYSGYLADKKAYTEENKDLNEQRRRTDNAYFRAALSTPTAAASGAPASVWDEYKDRLAATQVEDEKLKAMGGRATGEILPGAVGQLAAGNIGAVATMQDFFNQYYTAPTVFNDDGTVNWAASVAAHKPSEIVQESVDRLHAKEDTIRDRANEHIAGARTGRSALGQTLVDAGVSGIQMAGDAVINAIAPGAGLAAMGVRAFGNAAADARAKGADVARQFGYGAAVAGVEVLSEKMFDGLAGIYGKGATDEIVEKVIGKLANSEGGQRILKWLASGLGEAAEEWVAGAIDPALESIIDNAGIFAHYDENTMADILHDGLVGFLLGGLGGLSPNTTVEQTARTEYNQSNGQTTREGSDHAGEAVRNESKEWFNRVGAGERDAGVSQRAEARRAAADARRAEAEDFRNQVAASGESRQISAEELSILNGSSEQTAWTVPAGVKTDAMLGVEQDAAKNGYTVDWFIGEIRTNDGGVSRAVVDLAGKKVWISADDPDASPTQLWDHEKYHTLSEETRSKVADRLNAMHEAVLNDLIEAYVDIYDWALNQKDAVRENGTSRAVFGADYVLEEILADAYAGIDIFAGISDSYEGATRFSRETQNAVSHNAAESHKTSGPPEGVRNSRAYPNRRGESYELSDEFQKKVPNRDRHTFLRSLANQTTAIGEGKTKNIAINTADRLYLFEADGYMSGRIVERINLNTKANYARDARKEFLRGAYQNAENTDLWSDAVSRYGGESRDDLSVLVRGRSENGGNDKVSGSERESDGTGDHDGAGEDFEGELTDLGAGTMYYDGKNGYIVNEDGSITKFSSIITPKQNADYMPAVERGDTSAMHFANRPPSLYDLAYAMYTGGSDQLYRQLSERQDARGGPMPPAPDMAQDDSGRMNAKPRADGEPEAKPELPVDYLSILDLGYGPVSASRLRDLLMMGEVERYVEDGRIRFRRAKGTE